ncbi:MAG TPA: diguanylate cyclase, partial [Actinoplanes sp.]|nr:diguanylate cyclase [Actinoplanes sp.]
MGWKFFSSGHRIAAVALVVLVVAAQIVALVAFAGNSGFVDASYLALDVIGAAYSWLAGARVRRGRLMWRLIAAGRTASVLTTFLLVAYNVFPSAILLWAGFLARVACYLLIAAGVLTASMHQYRGRARYALAAEVVTVLAAAFMAVWYLAICPILETQTPRVTWIAQIGWPLGDLLLLAAVSSIALRGAATRFTAPVWLFVGGLGAFLVADFVWQAVRALGLTTEIPSAGLFLIAGALTITVAPMLAVADPSRLPRSRTGRPPAWATHLPMAATLVVCLLMLVVPLIEQQFLPWGGLVAGLGVMNCAAAARQMVSLREDRDQIVTDGLTGLANRAGLDQALERAQRREGPYALLLLDLDGFKLINDAYGHAAGDMVLVEFGRLLRASVRSDHLAARIGGDEFALLLPGVESAADACGIAQRILTAAAANPVQLDNDRVPVRASIGVAVAGPGADGKTLTRHADIAMYHSKRAGSHGHTVYQPSMVDRRVENAALAEDLGNALDRGELHLLYQPLVDLATGRAVAVEALLRWEHPVHGLVSPARFIPIAERSGVIVPIGLWVIEEALRQIRELRELTGEPLYVSVNLSPRQLREPTIVHEILAVLRRCGTDPAELVLEVTESALVDESSGIAELRTLRAQG